MTAAGEWTSDRIREVAASWVWVPPDTSEARTPEYHLVSYPPTFLVPTHVAWSRSSRPAAAVVDEVLSLPLDGPALAAAGLDTTVQDAAAGVLECAGLEVRQVLEHRLRLQLPDPGAV